MGYGHMGNPHASLETDKYTLVKTLPPRKLRCRVVITLKSFDKKDLKFSYIYIHI